MRSSCSCILAVILFSSAVSAEYFQWVGGTGQWFDATGWANGQVPDSDTFQVDIVDIGHANGALADVLLAGTAAEVDDLYIGPQAQLTLGAQLSLRSRLENLGQLTIDSRMVSSSGFQGAMLFEVRGGGEIEMAGGDWFFAQDVINYDNTIRGIGNVVGNSTQGTQFTHRGTISADVPGGRLRMDVTTINEGVLEATNSGILELRGAFVNTSRSIVAHQDSIVEASGASIIGGTLDATQGSINLLGAQLTDVRIQGDMDFQRLHLSGAIENRNILNGAASQLLISDSVEFSGGGSVIAEDIVLANVPGPAIKRFTNHDNHVFFRDHVGVDEIQNHGVIESNGGVLLANMIRNTGTLRNVTVQSPVTIENAGGVIEIDSGQTAELAVSGGTLVGNEVSDQLPRPFIRASLRDVQLQGDLDLRTSSFFAGTIVNNAEVNAQGRVFRFDSSAPVVVQGTGFIRMMNAGFEGDRANVQNIGHTLSGTGDITVARLGNTGVIEADGGRLRVIANQDPQAGAPTNEYKNAGVLRAVNSGELTLSNTFNTSAGVVSADASSHVRADFIDGGTITGEGMFLVGGLNGVTNETTVFLGGNTFRPVSLAGTITNNGAIISSREQGFVDLPLEFRGSGVWHLEDVNFLETNMGPTRTFVNGANHEIRGGGTFSNSPGGYGINYGIISATDDLDMTGIVDSMTNYGTVLVTGEGQGRREIRLGLSELANRGDVTISENAQLSVGRLTNHLDGVISGDGVILNQAPFFTESFGEIAPSLGSTPTIGSIRFGFGLSLFDPGQLTIDVSTDGEVTLHDLVTTSVANLGGKLQIESDDAFILQPYESLTILQADNRINGTFDDVLVPDIGPSMGFAVTYEFNSVYITPAILGDANLDGLVDVSDFNAWNSNKTRTGTWADGDFNQDGFVDNDDFLIWNTFRFTSLSAAVSAIPEPSSSWLLLCALTCVLFSRRR